MARAADLDPGEITTSGTPFRAISSTITLANAVLGLG
jgi:hypothetical protein